MKPEFLDDVKVFLKRLKQDSENFKGNRSFEALMRGLSDGSVDFRWSFGGRLVPHKDNVEKPKSLPLRYIISAPIIYAMIIPVLLLDLSVSLYQAFCFRLWKIPQVRRSQFVIIDRHRLDYLRGLQKFNCIYCGYANGVVNYARRIAGETERYWCPVKHETDIEAPHNFYIQFADYNDPEAWDAIQSGGISDWGNGD